MIALRTVFQMKCSKDLVFKGGTSLSKAWQIIERFSEDIDLGLDRSFFGYTGELARKNVTALRKASCSYITEDFLKELNEQLEVGHIRDFYLEVIEFERSDTDPIAIALNYKSLTDHIDYIQPRILIEISSRSLRDPNENKLIQSLIGEQYPDLFFADKKINIPTVLPSRTFLEKIFLLHEEFQKPLTIKIRSDRMTRHLYDISKLMGTHHEEEALSNEELYRNIVKHREMLTKLLWVNYLNHKPGTIDFIPPPRVIQEWKKDYEKMRESMFYGHTDSFEDLISNLKDLRYRINSLTFEIDSH